MLPLNERQTGFHDERQGQEHPLGAPWMAFLLQTARQNHAATMSERLFILESRDNDGKWWLHRVLNSRTPLEAWRESCQWIKANAHHFHDVWKLKSTGHMNPRRWRVRRYNATPDTGRMAAIFKADDLEQ